MYMSQTEPIGYSRISGLQSSIVGGSTTGEHAIATYGDMDSQHAMPGTNQIATNMTGGRKRKTGGRGLTEVAVPALLLYANTVYKPTRKRQGKSKRHRRRNNFRDTRRRRRR